MPVLTPRARRRAFHVARSRPAARPAPDPRWTTLATALADLAEAGRRSVRIVDADCGDGSLLLRAVRHARRLGFVAIEGRGVSADRSSAAQARRAAARLHDDAIGLTFASEHLLDALREEAEMPADIVLWRSPGDPRAVDGPLRQTLRRAGRLVIETPGMAALAAA